MSTPENREAAFIGKIVAGATHELRNVLAIIKESAGLIADVINAPDQPGSAKNDRLIRTVGRVEAQVKRGSELLTSLNRFAHSLDHAVDEIDLDEVTRWIPFLCQRMARKGRHTVQAERGDGDLRMAVNLLRLQMALHATVACCLEQLPEGGTLNLRPVRHDGGPAVEFRGELAGQVVRLDPSEASGWSQLTAILDELRATLESVETLQGFRVTLPG